MLHSALYILIIAVCALTWINFLTASGNMLSFLARWGNQRLPEWMARPLFNCANCCAGWIAIIYHIYLNGGLLWSVVPFCFAAMYTTELLNKYLRAYE
jgi:hypothetical protein